MMMIREVAAAPGFRWSRGPLSLVKLCAHVAVCTPIADLVGCINWPPSPTSRHPHEPPGAGAERLQLESRAVEGALSRREVAVAVPYLPD